MRLPNGKIYMDYNATTPIPETVRNVISEALKTWGNPSSKYDVGQEAKHLINQSRVKVAKMIGAREQEIIFTSGGTEANHITLWTAIEYYRECFKSSGKTHTTNKPHIITTNVEHDAILLPLKKMESEQFAEVDFLPVTKTTGAISTEELVQSIKPETCLITVMMANNETGVLMPINEIARRIQEINAIRLKENLCRILFHTDAAQAIGKLPVDVEVLGVDYLTIVGHKFYGPRVGALYVRGLDDSSTPLFPIFFGGGQERGFRPGTENTPMICGLGEAAELVSNNVARYRENMENMRTYLEKKLLEDFGNRVVINCAATERLPNTCNVSFVTNISGAEILAKCPNLLASTAAACHGNQGVSGTLLKSGVSMELAKTAIRLSIGRDTDAKQIEYVVEMLRYAIEEDSTKI